MVGACAGDVEVLSELMAMLRESVSEIGAESFAEQKMEASAAVVGEGGGGFSIVQVCQQLIIASQRLLELAQRLAVLA